MWCARQSWVVFTQRPQCGTLQVMPTVQTYMPDDVYTRLVKRAASLDMTVGKLMRWLGDLGEHAVTDTDILTEMRIALRANRQAANKQRKVKPIV